MGTTLASFHQRCLCQRNQHMITSLQSIPRNSMLRSMVQSLTANVKHSLDKCDCSNVVAHLTQNNNHNQCNRLSGVTKVKSTGMSQNCARQLNCVVGRSDWPDKALPASKMFVARFLNKKFWTQYSILRKTLQNIWDEYRIIPMIMIGFKNVYH